MSPNKTRSGSPEPTTLSTDCCRTASEYLALEDAAFCSALIADFSHVIAGIAKHFCPYCRERAKDMSQDICLKLWYKNDYLRQKLLYNGLSDMVKILYTIAHNTAVDIVRKKSRAAAVTLLPADSIPNCPEVVVSPEVTSAFEVESLKTLMKRVLTPRQYVVLILKSKGYKASEIALRINTTPVAVFALIRDAKKKIQQSLTSAE